MATKYNIIQCIYSYLHIHITHIYIYAYTHVIATQVSCPSQYHSTIKCYFSNERILITLRQLICYSYRNYLVLIINYDTDSRLPVQTRMVDLSKYSIDVQFNHVLSTRIVLRFTKAVLWINYTARTMQRRIQEPELLAVRHLGSKQ